MHLQGTVCFGSVQVWYRCIPAVFCSGAVLGNVVLQPPFDLVVIPSDPFDVVPHCLQCLLPGHLPSTSIRCLLEEMLHLQDQHGEMCHKKPIFSIFALTQTI